jgi:hypothetical protein
MSYHTLGNLNLSPVNYPVHECKFYSEIKHYNNMYNAYTNGNNKAGYATDVFEKNCKNAHHFNTLKETSNNTIYILKRPALQ